MATRTLSTSLYSLARSCDEVLASLVEHTKSSDYQQYSNDLEDGLGRFRVWAKNLGAFQNPKSNSSLDHRLIDGKEMRDAVRENLEELNGASVKGIAPSYIVTRISL